MNKKKHILTAAAVLTLACTALDVRLKSVTYRIASDKIGAPVRLAIIADLHGCRWGKNMETLLHAVHAEAPDAVLMTGDLFHKTIDEKNAHRFAAQIAAEYPTFYVTGNHEIKSGQAKAMKKALRSYGVTVLEGNAVPLRANGEMLWICGADDPKIGSTKSASQRAAAYDAVPAGACSVLLSHRPELAEQYAAEGFDVVVSGHAHGGQWRIPYLLNGVYAPSQGILPAYAGGMYDLGSTKLIVSRGLSRETTPVPRIFNRPELVMLDIN